MPRILRSLLGPKDPAISERPAPPVDAAPEMHFMTVTQGYRRQMQRCIDHLDWASRD